MKKIIIILFLLSISLQFYAQKNDNNTPQNKIYDGFIGDKQAIDSSYAELLNVDLSKEEIIISKKWWVIFLLVVLFYFFIAVYYNFTDEFSSVFKSLFNAPFFRQTVTQQSSVVNSFILFLNILFFLSVSIILMLFFKNKNIQIFNNSVFTFSSILLVLVSYHFIKQLFAKIWAYVFEEKYLYSVYVVSMRIANVFMATFLLFFIFSAVFNPFCKEFCVFLSFLLILTVFILRVWRVFSEFFQYGFSLFYLILYLCTVEILPVLVVLRYFSVV
ncbi:MAG: DUF4271 domain-containing protein [Bacteroidales bacterium]|nr:DUF4271 domain-containing protein [Bacteroidales bacterium]